MTFATLHPTPDHETATARQVAGRLNEQQLFRIVQRIRPNATDKFGARWCA